ncbi:hypothetical protein [Sphingorhabdus sp.]|jgi:hypothetical protein|uniref:hypothetical protein n=1 Tax=Sphingorhabdus sp. TaxID=1902408 RepID=UPI002C567B5D|nr:hypothetical protein [Sphingorhabdus sp.]HMT42595.1 hypothetical protein [Sphingorhabdus sp.]
MESLPISTRFGPDYTPKMVTAIAAATATIARLDARIIASPVAKPWAMRATWSGYARALQLQSAEVEEIDVFSWGCDLRIPGRPPLPSHLDLFDRFEEWRASLDDPDTLAWRDGLPTAIGDPAASAAHPPLVRALDTVRQLARIDHSIMPWLGLPFALRDRGLTASPLPCLAGGAKAFRLKPRPNDDDWLVMLRGLERAATIGLERLHSLERHYRDAQRTIAAEYRPGALPALLALIQYHPLLSPQSAAELLCMSIAGASKLIERAATTGLLVEITQRRSWRQFLTPDLAADFGYVRPKRGRPAKEPPPLPVNRDLAAVFDAFDSEMAAIDNLLVRKSDPS